MRDDAEQVPRETISAPADDETAHPTTVALLLPAAAEPFAHAYHTSSLLKMDLVHHCPHKEDPASASQENMSLIRRIRQCARIKALPLVANDKRHFPVNAAPACDIHALSPVVAIAVDDGI